MQPPPADRDYLILGTVWAVGFAVGFLVASILVSAYLLAGVH